MSVSVAAIVLAAGQSRCMEGQNKLLCRIGDRPMVRVVVEMLASSRVELIVVVTGHEANMIVEALSGLDVAFVHNPAFETGMASSLKAGIAALPEGVDGALVCLGDMPNVTMEDIRRLGAAFESGGGETICVPVHDGRRGNPVLLPCWLFGEVEGLSGDTGARGLIEFHADRVEEVPVNGPGIHLDIDVPDDL